MLPEFDIPLPFNDISLCRVILIFVENLKFSFLFGFVGQRSHCASVTLEKEERRGDFCSYLPYTVAFIAVSKLWSNNLKDLNTACERMMH